MRQQKFSKDGINFRDIISARICASNPWTWMCNFVYTRDSQDLLNPVRKWPSYKYLHNVVDILAAKDENMKPLYPIVAIKKSRQMLISWTCVAYALWDAIHGTNRHWIIQSQKETKAQELLSRVKFILQNQDYISEDSWAYSKTRIFFANGSIIEAVAQGPDQVVQYSPSGVIMDECALQESAEEAFYAIIPALKGGGQLIAPSTPRGYNFFYRLCHEIEGVKTITVHYSMHPEYKKYANDPKWKEAMMKKWGMTPQAWAREMEIDFSVSLGQPVFSPPFSKETHVCPLAPNPAFPIYEGWDFGYRNPAVVWAQHNQFSRQHLVLATYQAKNVSLADFAAQVKKKRAELCPNATFIACADKAGRAVSDIAGIRAIDVLASLGIYPASRASNVIDGIRYILEMLSFRIDGTPGVLINESCTDLITALSSGVTWKTKTEDDLDETKNDIDYGPFKHIIDAWRYIFVNFYMPDKQAVSIEIEKQSGLKKPNNDIYLPFANDWRGI